MKQLSFPNGTWHGGERLCIVDYRSIRDPQEGMYTQYLKNVTLAAEMPVFQRMQPSTITFYAIGLLFAW